MSPRMFQLVDRRTETPSVATLRLEPIDGKPYPFRAGSFGLVALKGFDSPARAFSFASSPGRLPLELTVERMGRLTSALLDAPLGSQLAIRGPFGRFHLPDRLDRDLLMIAGGTGIVPLRSMLCSMNERADLSNDSGRSVRAVTLIYSVRTPDDVLYRAELPSLVREWPKLRLELMVTRPSPSVNWSGRTGRLSSDRLVELAPDVPNRLSFLCGSPPFVLAVIRMLTGLGVPRDQIRTEQWLQPDPE